MEWRSQSDGELAFLEAQRWLEEVTKKQFGSQTFRVALEDGVLLCDLINALKPGLIKRVNRLSTPIAGLDNVNMFLKACEKLGLNEAQLFHPGDLQDVSTRVTVRCEETSRRLKTVLITIYWLGKRAEADPLYIGPQLNLKAFEGFLGKALSKAVEESVHAKSSVRDSGLAEGWYSDREDLFSLKQSGYRREDSVESVDSVDSRTISVASDCTLRVDNKGCCSDAEAQHCFRMADGSMSDAPSRERHHGPSALRRKGVEHQEGGRCSTGPLIRLPTRCSHYIGSKSMGDQIHDQQRSVGGLTFEPSAIHRVQQKQLHSIRVRMKESEAKWQEDLSKWKSRRRSVNSDLHRKREERELITKGGTGTITPPEITGVPGESSYKIARSHMLSCRTLVHSSSAAVAVSDSEPYQQQPGPDLGRQASLLENIYAGGTRISATLPRGFRRSEGCSRLSMGVTPRPFGTKPSKVSSLPRVYAMDDSHKNLISGQRDHSLIPSFLSGQGKVTTSANTGQSQSSTHLISIKKGDNKEEGIDERSSAPPLRSLVTNVTMAPSFKQPSSPVVLEIGEVKVGNSDMRVCLNQKPNSKRDFGFKALWDSTGACVKFVQTGSPAELCGLQMGDEIVALGGCRVADMTYEQFKESMDTAQQNGSLLMDIRHHGQNGWGSGPPSLTYKSHKTINLTSSNVGRLEHIVSISTSSNSPGESAGKTQVNGQPANGVLSKMVNGSFLNKSAAVQNKGGSESAISDLQVPSISATSSRWLWDHEEERRRQEKWQMEQERLLQEKYRRDQEKLEEEWRRAQQEAYGEELRGLEEQKSQDVLSNGNATSYVTPPFFNQSTTYTSVTPNQNAEKVEVPQNIQGAVQIAAGHYSQKTAVECDSTTKSRWSEESYGFAKLTVSDRTKSKSTPALEGLHKQDAKGSSKEKAHVSQAEQERLKILEEMRKRTPLLTDSSWIRQRSPSINKEPINLTSSIRRYESLDNLLTSNSLSRQSYTSSRPHSALGSTGTYRSGRSSLGPSSAIFSSGLKQSSWFAFNSSTPQGTTSSEPHPNSQQCGSASHNP